MYQENIQTTFFDHQVTKNTFEDIYKDVGDGIIINLFQVNGRAGCEKKCEITIPNAQKSLMAFSKSGMYFGIYIRNTREF